MIGDWRIEIIWFFLFYFFFFFVQKKFSFYAYVKCFTLNWLCLLIYKLLFCTQNGHWFHVGRIYYYYYYYFVLMWLFGQYGCHFSLYKAPFYRVNADPAVCWLGRVSPFVYMADDFFLLMRLFNFYVRFRDFYWQRYSLDVVLIYFQFQIKKYVKIEMLTVVFFTVKYRRISSFFFILIFIKNRLHSWWKCKIIMNLNNCKLKIANNYYNY